MLPVIEALRALAAEDIERFRKAKTRAAGLYALAALFALTAYACAVGALVFWAARHGDPVLAAGVVAAGFAALALVVLAIVAALNRAERRRMAERRARYSSVVGSAASSALLGIVLRPQALAAGAVVLIAGLALGLFDEKRPDDGRPDDGDNDRSPPRERG